MEPKIYIKSQIKAEELIASDFHHEISHIISITDPETKVPEIFYKQRTVLNLIFHDVETSENLSPHFIAPNKEHISKIINFSRQYLKANQKKDILFHCKAGLSRSPAAAFIFLSIIYGRNKESKAVEHLLSIRPHAIPNRTMLKLADRILRSRLFFHGQIIFEQRIKQMREKLHGFF